MGGSAVSVSYLTQDEIALWAPWFWVILAYKWTADQGRPVPPLTPRWRTEACDLIPHAQTLVRAWLPFATDVTSPASVADVLHLVWRDTRLTRWLLTMRDPNTPRARRQYLARQYATWHRAIHDRMAAKESAWLTLAFRGDRFSWLFDVDNYGDYWEEPAILDLVHWLKSLADILIAIPEVAAV